MQKVLKLDFCGQSVTFVIHSHHILPMVERKKKKFKIKNPLLILSIHYLFLMTFQLSCQKHCKGVL